MCFVVVCFAEERYNFVPCWNGTIEAKLAERGQQLHPVPLNNVKAPQGRGARHFWTDCTALVYSFPLGKTLSRSAGKVVEYIEPTGQLLNHHLKLHVKHCISHYRMVWPFKFMHTITVFYRQENPAHSISNEIGTVLLGWTSVCDPWERQSCCHGNPLWIWFENRCPQQGSPPVALPCRGRVWRFLRP